MTWHEQYTTFTTNRSKYWRPKIYKNLLEMNSNALTGMQSYQQAINLLDEHMLEPAGLIETITSIYKDAGRVWGGYAYQSIQKQVRPKKQKALLPMGQNESLIADIIAYFRLHLLRDAVFPITETHKAWILNQLIQGQEQGLSLSDTAAMIMKAGYNWSHALVISRTETIKAANYGAMQGAKRAGYQTNKKWISAKDNRTRRIPRDEYGHLQVNGTIKPMDEPFLVPNKYGGFDKMMQPGDPVGNVADVVNCRCTVGFIVQRDAQGLPIRESVRGGV